MRFARNWENKRTQEHRNRPGLIATVVCGVLFLLLGAGCEIPVSWESAWESPAAPTTTTTTATWQEVAPGVARFDQRVGSGDAAARLILWRFSPEASLTWSIVASSTEPKSVSKWADEDPKALLVLNGGYFHADGKPSGWAQSSGHLLTGRSFEAQRSGLVSLGEAPALLLGTTATATIREDGLQSYPWLIESGTLAFTQETGQYARRTFLGMDANRNWYVGIVPSESLTLHQLATVLFEVPVQWRRVINLDGGPSTGLISRFPGAEDRFDSFSPIPYVIVARPRS